MDSATTGPLPAEHQTRADSIVEPSIEKLKAPMRPSSGRSPNSMNGPLYMQTIHNKVIVRRVKRKDDGPMKSLARWLVDNQIGFSFNLIALLFLAHLCLPKARAYTSRFFTLSHYDRLTGKYAVGEGDWYFLAFFIVVFTGLRALFMETIAAPLAKLGGISKRKEITRFSEQAWMIVYYSVFWSLGLYIYRNSDYFLNLRQMWTNWPRREVTPLVKAYTLVQLSFWFQQILIINIEERRKDHWQMFCHHIITISLLGAAYVYHQTPVANTYLIIMDGVDLILPTAKCLKYTGFSTVCDILFGIFLVFWFFTRHILFNIVLYSVYSDSDIEIPDACYKGTATNLTGPIPIPHDWGHLVEPFRDFQGRVCWGHNIRWYFLSFLIFLQVLAIMWFVLVIKVAIKVVRGASAEDVRSDDEGEHDVEGKVVYEEKRPLEEEVGVEDIDLKSWERRSGVERRAASSGIHVPGHSDRKELLGRIGCEKQME